MKKIKNLLISIGITIISFPNKIFAVVDPQPLYAPTPVTISGKAPERIWLIMIRILIIPIALLIGTTVYLKKSKSSKKKKVMVSIGMIIFAILLCFAMSKIYRG